jgi:phage terminase Nu1 subunit (DNA packaging protein)
MGNYGKRYFTEKEFAEMLKISQKAIRNAIERGLVVKSEGHGNKIDRKNAQNLEYIENVVNGNKKNDVYSDDNQSKAELDREHLKLKIQETKKKNQLSDLKFLKESGEVIEVDLMQKTMYKCFDVFFKSLLELPSNTMDEMLAVINSAEDGEKKAQAIEFLSKQIKEILEDGLEKSKNEMEKVYDKR